MVDATNVARSRVWARELRARGIDAADIDAAAAALVDAVASWAAREGVRTELVFDGVGPVRELGAFGWVFVDTKQATREEGI